MRLTALGRSKQASGGQWSAENREKGGREDNGRMTERSGVVSEGLVRGGVSDFMVFGPLQELLGAITSIDRFAISPFHQLHLCYRITL